MSVATRLRLEPLVFLGIRKLFFLVSLPVVLVANAATMTAAAVAVAALPSWMATGFLWLE
jgi:hypothetical protein